MQGTEAPLPVFEAEFGTHAVGIARGSLEHHSQSRHRRAITKEPGGSVVLTHHHIQPTIVIKVTEGRTALFPKHSNAGDVRVPRLKGAIAPPPQHQAITPVLTGQIGGCSEKVLRTQQVLHPIAIQVAHLDRKHRSPLCLHGQRHRVKTRTAIKKDHGRQLGGPYPRRCGDPQTF